MAWSLIFTGVCSGGVFACVTDRLPPPSASPGARLRYASILHAVVTTAVACAFLYAFAPLAWRADAALWTSHSWWATHTLAFVMGYMVNDLTLGWRYPGVLDKAMYAHHAIVLAVFFGALATQHGVPLVVLGLFNEASTPFVNLNFLLREGLNSSKLFYANAPRRHWIACNGVAMWVTFLVCRILFNPMLLYVAWTTWTPPPGEGVLSLPVTTQFWVFLSLFAGLTCLNVQWFFKMTRGLLRAARDTQPRTL